MFVRSFFKQIVNTSKGSLECSRLHLISSSTLLPLQTSRHHFWSSAVSAIGEELLCCTILKALIQQYYLIRKPSILLC